MAFNSYVSEAMSTNDIRKIVKEFRNLLKLKDGEYVNVIKYLDILYFLDPMFDYQIVEDNELPKSIQGKTDVVNHVIKIKQSVYEGACGGNGTDRMTIAHEIGHYVLVCINGINFARNTDRTGYVKTYKDPEWQATVFASEFLIPAHTIQGLSVKEISEKFGVTISAAKAQLKHSK